MARTNTGNHLNATRGSPASQSVRSENASGLLLTENKALVALPSPLLHKLTQQEKDKVMKCGIERALPRGAMLFRQGSRHEGIYLIKSGRVRVFYTSPSGKQITVAYSTPGTFIGDPEIF